MLLQLHDLLDWGNSADALFWAICLVAFYGVFRKSLLLPVLTSSFDLPKQLTKADFKIFPWGVLITICLSKTIQFLGQIVEIPLPFIPHSKLSHSHHHKCLSLYDSSVCFQLSSIQLGRPKSACKNFYLWLLCVHPANSSYVPWFRPQAVCWELFSQGWGVLCIYQAGVPIKLIKALGNWLSDTILIIKQCL